MVWNFDQYEQHSLRFLLHSFLFLWYQMSSLKRMREILASHDMVGFIYTFSYSFSSLFTFQFLGVPPKRKQTKRVLRKIYYSPQSKSSMSWQVGAESKLFPDSALGNSLCTSGYKTKSEKPLFFSWPPMPPEIELLPRGVIPWGPKYAQEP